MVLDSPPTPGWAHVAVTCLAIAVGLLLWSDGQKLVAFLMLLGAGANVVWSIAALVRRHAQHDHDPST
jgi:hypothetical protein